MSWPVHKQVVHVLFHGHMLCDKFGGLVPGQWPKGHVWTYLDGVDVSCPECIDRRKQIRLREMKR